MKIDDKLLDRLISDGEAHLMLQRLMSDDCVYCGCDTTNKQLDERFCDKVCIDCGQARL